MKKKVMALGVLLVMAFSPFALTGCDLSGKHKVYESGYFQYIVVGENSRFPRKNEDGVVAIVGLTESGQEQEAIDFPRIICGKDVRYIGYSPIKLGLLSDGIGYYKLESSNLKKVYMMHDVAEVYAGLYSMNVDIMDCNMTGIGCATQGYVYLYRERFESLREDGSTQIVNEDWLVDGRKIRPANITFLNNYSDEINGGYYRLDNIEPGENIPKPPNPERNGYEFTGWFTDSNCLNIWDFDSAKELSNDTEFRLYAGWQQK
jgi:uncharacterized repeat protein (TIGR02543 family)